MAMAEADRIAKLAKALAKRMAGALVYRERRDGVAHDPGVRNYHLTLRAHARPLGIERLFDRYVILLGGATARRYDDDARGHASQGRHQRQTPGRVSAADVEPAGGEALMDEEDRQLVGAAGQAGGTHADYRIAVSDERAAICGLTVVLALVELGILKGRDLRQHR